MKRCDTKEAVEYCWAITQSGEWSCCGLSEPSVLEIGFKLGCLLYAYSIIHTPTHFRLKQSSTYIGPSRR